jgi:hypothetical protein
LSVKFSHLFVEPVSLGFGSLQIFLGKILSFLGGSKNSFECSWIS